VTINNKFFAPWLARFASLNFEERVGLIITFLQQYFFETSPAGVGKIFMAGNISFFKTGCGEVGGA